MMEQRHLEQSEKSHLPQLPKGWVWTRLDEFTEIILGQSPPSSTYNETGIGYPFYQGKTDFGETYPTPRVWCSAPTKFAAKGDVLLSVRAPVGPTNIASEKSAIGRGLAAIRGLEGIQSLFILYLIRSNQNKIAGLGTGSTFAAISGNQIKTYQVSLPPLHEQHRIVTKIEELFSDLDAGVAELEKTKAQLKRYRQAVLKAAVEGKLTAEWRAANKDKIEPASVLLERIHTERANNANGKEKELLPVDGAELGELPDGWKWTSVYDIGRASGGLTKNPDRNKLLLQMPYLRVANVYAGRLELGEIKTIGVTREEVDKLTVSKGDLLVVEGNGSPDQIGRMALWNGSISPILHQNHIIKVRFDVIEIGNFVLLWFLSRDGRTQISANSSSTSGLYTLSISKVASLRVPLPPLAEQHQIVAEVERRLSITDEIEKTVDAALKQAERLRQSILKRAFEGKLVPQDPSDEPADKLLERIREAKNVNPTPVTSVKVGKIKKAIQKQPRLIS